MPQPRRAASASALPGEIIVVADATAGLEASGATVASAAVDAAPLGKALKKGKAELRPLFGATEARVRRDLSAFASASTSGESLPDLSVYYRVDAPDGTQLDDLAASLLDSEGIAGAYVKPLAEPAEEDINTMAPAAEDAPPATPDLTARQIYLDAAPAGIDARYAWTLPGGRGAGVRIIDIEGAWRFDHEDLLQNQGGANGTQSADVGWRNHGTAVVGEFGGDLSSFGVTGICSDANVRGFSIFGNRGSARALRDAADALTAGDIILIELHRSGPGANGQGQDGFIAIEWWPDDFDAIRYAVGRGVIVVEAAGNGSRDLDGSIYNAPQAGFPPGWTNPFNRANRDSGAVVVGAGAPPPGTHGRDHGPDRSRLGFSNWGALVDVQGWGREVTTCGYGDLQGGADENLWYTDTFSGTSSASPIVVGALGCIQGVRRARGQAALTPAQARTTLRGTGSPQQDAPGRPTAQRIGNRPNLREVLQRIVKPIRKEVVKEGKEIKHEKRESKELKHEKFEIKEKREKEFKEFKEGKNEKHEFEVDKRVREFDPKGIREVDDRFDPLRRVGPEQGWEPDHADYGTGEEHFIDPALRPDLSGGALTHEDDLGFLDS